MLETYYQWGYHQLKGVDMRWSRRRKRAAERNNEGVTVSSRVTFSEFLVWLGVIFFFFLTLTPIFVPDVVPAFFGVREVGSPGASGYIPPKTLWDWFGLVAIPFAIVVVGYVLNRADRNHERRLQDQRLKEARELEDNRAQDAIVKDYLDQMTELLLTRGLRTSFSGDEVRSVARARTLMALRGVDGVRKATIVQFLYEARLIGYVDGEETADAVVEMSRVDLREADLRVIDLRGANLEGANLAEANLEGAILSTANLEGAILSTANLSSAGLGRVNFNRSFLIGADLSRSFLIGADFFGANLFRSVFIEADLRCSGFLWTDLSEANLRATDLREAEFRGGNLTNANLTDCRGLTLGQLLQAESLHGAILPDYINPADLGDKWSPPETKNTPEPKP